MADTLEIFGVEYTNVAGIIATDDNGNELTYTRGGHVTQDQDGYIVLPKTGGGGGGSSDFSTAEVTITNQSFSFYMTFNALYYDTESDLEIVTALLEQSEHYVTEWEFTSEAETDEYKFLIIEEFATLIGDITMNENSVFVTGDIDKFINDQNLVELHIRGNGTITIS